MNRSIVSTSEEPQSAKETAGMGWGWCFRAHDQGRALKQEIE
jgi:hypothetical protein